MILSMEFLSIIILTICVIPNLVKGLNTIHRLPHERGDDDGDGDNDNDW